MAAWLTQSALSLKTIGISHNPIEAINQACIIADMALVLNPEYEKARWTRFSLDCIQLNFKRALSRPYLPRSEYRQQYLQVIQSFSDYAFSKTERPTSDQLVAV